MRGRGPHFLPAGEFGRWVCVRALKQLGGQPNHHTPPPHRTTARMAVDQRAAEEDRLRAKWSDPVAAAAAGAQVRPPTQC